MRWLLATAGDELFSDAQGMKAVQLAKTAAGWKIAPVSWDDEREGVAIPGLDERMARDSRDGDRV